MAHLLIEGCDHHGRFSLFKSGGNVGDLSRLQHVNQQDAHCISLASLISHLGKSAPKCKTVPPVVYSHKSSIWPHERAD